ncbi:MAG: molybdate ABC transporter substrate-binding protein [Alphaproteobacteria bacterium]|nr:molybdate ABC transporter substrate-binding protein [Alphaproteobacteria bacterium]
MFAASSLTEVMNRLGRSYAATGHSAPAFNFAASSDLARQIEQGAEADIFVSADEAWMDYLSDRDLIVEGSRVNLAGNRLVLIAPADRPFSFTPQPGADLAAALKGGTLAIADPEGVPAGRYAREALESIGAWGAVEGKAARAESVRAALRFVESGEAAAGIVYATDALSAGVKVVVVAEFPAGSHTAITYPLARIASGEGQDFAAYLQSGEARSTLAAAGFLLPE